jgi:hypothetical protein
MSNPPQTLKVGWNFAAPVRTVLQKRNGHAHQAVAATNRIAVSA